MNKFFFIAGMICFSILTGCETKKGNQKLFDKLKKEVIANYTSHKSTFDKLKTSLKFNHIQEIELLQNGNVNVAYQVGDRNSDWAEIKNKEVFSEEVKKLLFMDGDTIDELLLLKEYVEKIKINRIWIINTVADASGAYFNQVDLRYSYKMNGLHFYYRICERGLDSPENGFYTVLIQNGRTGGKLSDNAIWYVK